MVLDMLSSVFGRSKNKNASSSSVTSSQNEHLVRSPPPVQPVPASARDEKGIETGWTELNWGSTSNSAMVGGNVQSPPSAASVPYPQLNVANVRLTPTTPIDNVPFAHSQQLNAVRLSRGTQMTDLGKCFDTIDRVGVHLQSERFEYNFQLENTVMREVQATSNGFGF